MEKKKNKTFNEKMSELYKKVNIKNEKVGLQDLMELHEIHRHEKYITENKKLK